MYSTQATGHVSAPRSTVYRALVDAAAIAQWRVPADMSSHVHEFDAREGGAFRISLTYDAPSPLTISGLSHFCSGARSVN